jgi:hypothetical protein
MKDVRFIWGLPQEDSFTKLKELVTSAPVLWRHYLEGVRHPVEIWTEHKNLEYF